jgi:hypothetical protein
MILYGGCCEASLRFFYFLPLFRVDIAQTATLIFVQSDESEPDCKKEIE